ncbi:hypothetical protein EDD29_2758 [Actinocorallia herbida]|uniref:Uncharacterized protein n=1 Tax=Actinocorallia herbida TaxID=58109 RepID=A0A3N1CWX5_9ACTN|nr:hypothetical protein [Actinocorallia herbida]ROO85218.1 hypothetical protein EDD29_2758 [Actinocorallia herbida]
MSAGVRRLPGDLQAPRGVLRAVARGYATDVVPVFRTLWEDSNRGPGRRAARPVAPVLDQAEARPIAVGAVPTGTDAMKAGAVAAPTG